MKILAINGSHRGVKGRTSLLLEEIFKGARSAGSDCEVVHLSDLNIKPCLACQRCQTEEHYLRCVFEEKDDAAGVFAKMTQADLIIYATPVYIFGMSGLLKIFLDRLFSTSDVLDLQMTNSGLFFHHKNPEICSKPFVTLVTCGNLEPETPANVLSYFKNYSMFMDAPQAGVLVRNAGRLMGLAEAERREKFPAINDMLAAYQQAGRELTQDTQISKATQKKANQEIMPLPPIVKVLKRLPIKPLRERVLAFAREKQKELDIR